jgi:hypothetical protein
LLKDVFPVGNLVQGALVSGFRGELQRDVKLSVSLLVFETDEAVVLHRRKKGPVAAEDVAQCIRCDDGSVEVDGQVAPAVVEEQGEIEELLPNDVF